MKEKTSFIAFHMTIAGIIIIFISAAMGVFTYFMLKDHTQYAGWVGGFLALAMYVSGFITAVKSTNGNIDKNIKDREKEQTGKQ